MAAAIEILITAKDSASGPLQAVSGHLRTLETSAKGADSSLSKLGGAAGAVATGIGTIGLAAGGVVATGLTAAVVAASSFEKGMSAVKAASGANVSQMQQLSAAAIALGSDTQLAGIGATDAAQAMEELAKGGVSVSDQLGGATKGALLLASAGAISVGEAAGIATKAMNIFGLSGADVAHVADLLAAGANKSATDVGALGQAFNQSAAVAKNAGLSIEELTGTLAFLAQRGIEGSDAGTSLKTALLALQAPTDVAATTMRDLGINVRDANGNMLPFAQIADVLKERLSGLSAAQRDAALKTIFGNDAIRVGIALYEGGGSAIRDWTANVNDAGIAARTGATRNDNLAGSLDQLGAVVQTAAIQVGTKFIPVVRTATDGVASLIDKLMKSPEAQEALDNLATKGSQALQLLISKVSDPTFQAEMRKWATVTLNVATAVVDLAGKVGGVLGPVLQGAALLFQTLDGQGQRNVIMFGLVAGAALKYHSAIGMLATAVTDIIGKFAAKEAAKASLTTANDALAGSAGRTALSFGAVGTAAGITAALLLPLAIFAGNVAIQMDNANAATQKVAASLNGDLSGAIAKIQATNWQESLVQTFTGHSAAMERASAAVHAWADGIGGMPATLAQLNTQLDISTAALANTNGKTSEEIQLRLAIQVALLNEIHTRTELNRVQAIHDDYLTSEAQAENTATAALLQHNSALGIAANAMGATATAATGLGNAFGVAARGMGEAVTSATSFTGTVNGSALATGAFAAAVAGATGAVGQYDAALKVLSSEHGQLAGYLTTLQGEWDTLTAKVTAQGFATTDQQARIDQLAPAIGFLNAKLGENQTDTQNATLAAVQNAQAADSAKNAATLYTISLAGQSAGQKIAAEVAKGHTGAIDDTEAAMRISEVAAKAYQTALANIQKKVSTDIAAPGLLESTDGANNYRNALNSIPGHVTTVIETVYTTTGSPPPGRAGGGSVTAGNLYLVGEDGPEYFVPERSGQVYAHGVSPTQGGGYALPRPAGGGGGNGGGITFLPGSIVVQGSVVTERQLVEAVYRGLLAKKRNNVLLGLA